MAPPGEAVFSTCEGAAGSVYCTWEAAGTVYVVRISSIEPTPQVTEFTAGP